MYTNTPKTDNFDYTGHERLKTFNLGYIDTGARWIDPLLGRFTTIDPLAETSRRWSPYTYAFDNPLMFIDPDGMEAKENKGFEYSDGYQTHNSRDNTGAVSFEGSYQNAGGEDKPKVKSASKTNTSALAVTGTAIIAGRTGIGALEVGGGFSIGEGVSTLGKVATGASGVGLLLMAGYAMSELGTLDETITDVGVKDKNSQFVTIYKAPQNQHLALKLQINGFSSDDFPRQLPFSDWKCLLCGSQIKRISNGICKTLWSRDSSNIISKNDL